MFSVPIEANFHHRKGVPTLKLSYEDCFTNIYASKNDRIRPLLYVSFMNRLFQRYVNLIWLLICVYLPRSDLETSAAKAKQAGDGDEALKKQIQDLEVQNVSSFCQIIFVNFFKFRFDLNLH